MFILIVRVVILYTILVVLMRLMGKRQLGEMQPFELAITLIIAELACIPMSDIAIPLTYGLTPIISIVLLHFAISFISRKSVGFRNLVDGKNVVVITPDGVDYKALKSLNMNIHDLLEATLTAGFFDLSEIQYAFFQTNGKLCAMPYAFNSPPTSGDLKITKDQQTFALPIIVDGKVYDLQKAFLTKDKVETVLKEFGLSGIKDVVLMTVDDSGKVYIQPRQGTFISRTVADLAGTKS